MKRTISAPDPAQAPPIDWDAYVQFAHNALTALSAGDHPDAVLLRQQLSDITFVELDYTGAGFFLTLDVSASAPRLSRSGVIGDVHAEAPDYEASLGVLLFVEDGVARTFEAFAYGEWPNDIGPFKCRYVRWEPHSNGTGATAVNVAHRDPTSMWSG